MKIVFLDIDGVLVTHQSLKERLRRGHDGEVVADRGCIDALNRITICSGASIVISSAWRFSGLLEMRAIAALWGIKAPVIDLMPDLTTKRPGGLWEGTERWKEIDLWLADHNTDSFVILDDIRDMGKFSDRHIWTEEAVGLTHSDANKSIRLLDAARFDPARAVAVKSIP